MKAYTLLLAATLTWTACAAEDAPEVDTSAELGRAPAGLPAKLPNQNATTSSGYCSATIYFTGARTSYTSSSWSKRDGTAASCSDAYNSALRFSIDQLGMTAYTSGACSCTQINYGR